MISQIEAPSAREDQAVLERPDSSPRKTGEASPRDAVNHIKALYAAGVPLHQRGHQETRVEPEFRERAEWMRKYSIYNDGNIVDFKFGLTMSGRAA